ncbi:MAG TPA: porin, partial [Hyphomicrobiaceae bacterium]|nr:porin [Hyphomicrobiaceae bacterium]
MPSAKAADLGGDCCADLEERVAELEATTARKGNRRMSLTVTGQVNRGVLFWDDGHKSDVYYGLDSTNSSSRFTFLGSAKITGAVSAGFEITIEIEAGGTSSKVSQFDEDGKVGTQINGAAIASFNAANVDAYMGDARRVLWWIEHKDVGRLTVGRMEGAGAVGTIDLGGISVVASSSVVLINGSFLIRGTNADYLNVGWGALGDPASSQGRTELIRYDSPTIAGFILSASVGEAGDYWGAMLRYAGEFSGIRIAAGIGYEKIEDRQTRITCIAARAGTTNTTCATGTGG